MKRFPSDRLATKEVGNFFLSYVDGIRERSEGDSWEKIFQQHLVCQVMFLIVTLDTSIHCVPSLFILVYTESYSLTINIIHVELNQFRTAAESLDLSTKEPMEFLWIVFGKSTKARRL